MKFRYTRTGLAAGALLTVSALTLAGCASSSEPDAEVDQTLTTNKADIKGDIKFATWWAYADQKLIDEFNVEYPNVNVTLDFTAIDSYPTKLQALASSGDLPDVFATQGTVLTSLTKAGQLYNLQDALATDAYDLDGTWGESFVPSLLSGANAALAEWETDGQVYGVPFNAISVASIYNTEIFDEVGITAPETFDDLLSNCEALSGAGYIPMSLTGAVWAGWWPALAWDQTMLGADVADFSTSNPDFIKGLQIVEKMAKAGCWADSQITTDIAGETSLFLQKKTAQFVTVPENFLRTVADGADFELGTYVLPPLDGKTPNRILGGGGANVIALSAKTDNASAAVAFAKFLTSKQAQTELAATQYTIPSIDIDLSSGGNALMEVYLTAASNGFTDASTYMPAWTAAGQTNFDTIILPSLILGKITAEEAAQQAADAFAK